MAKHLAKKYGGDPGLFSKIMDAEELDGYDEEQKKAIAAKVHKLATGMWPGEHGGKNPEGKG